MQLFIGIPRLLYDKCLALLPFLSVVHPQLVTSIRGITNNVASKANGLVGCPATAAMAATTSYHLHMQRCTGPSSSSSGSEKVDWMSWLGFAAAAAVVNLIKDSALAEAAAADGGNGDKARQAALSSAELAVSEAFQGLLHDWDRAAAMQQDQPGSSNSSSSSSVRPQAPVVTLDGDLMTVVIPLLPAADVPDLLRLIDRSLDQLALQGSRSSSQQQQTRLLGTSKVVQWDISRTLKNPPSVKRTQHSSSSSSREQLKVQVVLPLQPGGSPHERSSGGSSGGSTNTSQSSSRPNAAASSPSASAAAAPASGQHGYVSVVKPSGAFTADELALLAQLVTAANKPGQFSSSSSSGYYSEDTWLGPFGWPGSSSSSSGSLSVPPGFHTDGLGGVFGGLADHLVNRMFGGLVDDLLDELGAEGRGAQHDWQQQLQQQVQDLEQQLKESVPPEIVTWLQDFKRRQQQQQQEEERGGAALDDSAAFESSGVSNDVGSSTGAQNHHHQHQLPWQTPAARSAAQQLQQLGAQVYFPTAAALTQQQSTEQQQQQQQSDDSWGVLAGYEEQKQALEDFLLLPLKHPEVFDRVAARTRKSVSASGGSRPRAVLFEGPPGTGKTSSARLLSRRAALPLVYVPLEALVSKWYGESEQNLAKLFKCCESLGGCIIFLDELDSLATSRDRSDMHEASRRLLGVLLREIDGFDNTLGADRSISSSTGGDNSAGKRSSRRSVLIGATNRRQDLDAALLSRFDLSIHFGLPDEPCRAAILQQYANHLSSEQLNRIAERTRGFSGRDLRDICEQTERQWASKIIRGEVDSEQLPNVDDYLANVKQRKDGAGAGSRGGGGGGGGYPWPAGQYRT